MDVEGEEEDDDVEEDDVEEEDRSQDRDAHGHVTCHKRHVDHFLQKFTGKIRYRTLIPGQAFCASLHNRNAHGHVTRGILCGNLQGKYRTLPIPPALNTGP